MPSVLIVQELVAQYRVDFYEQLRTALRQDGIELNLVHGRARGERALRDDEARVPWAIQTRNLAIPVPGGRYLLWQPVLRRLYDNDLVIVEQANKHLLNVLLALAPSRARPKFAYWGHGGDLLHGSEHPRSESLKRMLGRRADWWFAYSEGSARRVERFRFPRERVTVVQNATSYTHRSSANRVPGRCVFVGAFTGEKQPEFLVAAGDALARTVDGFELIVAGSGPCRPVFEAATTSRPWLVLRSPVFGAQKADLLESAQLILMPGLVGLVAVDSMHARTPIVTVDSQVHSPEFEYLNSSNSIVLPESTTPDEYASAVADALSREDVVHELRTGCAATARDVTVEAMVTRFREGIVDALRTGKR